MVKIYQYSKFCNFTHKHSNFKCVHSKDIDTLTGDGSAVGHCTVGQPLGCSGSLNKTSSAIQSFDLYTVSVLHLCICWKFVVCSYFPKLNKISQMTNANVTTSIFNWWMSQNYKGQLRPIMISASQSPLPATSTPSVSPILPSHKHTSCILWWQ